VGLDSGEVTVTGSVREETSGEDEVQLLGSVEGNGKWGGWMAVTDYGGPFRFQIRWALLNLHIWLLMARPTKSYLLLNYGTQVVFLPFSIL
jgi:hypothetical protein